MLLCQEYATHRTMLLGKSTPICASYGVDCSTLNDQELLALLLYGNDAFNETSNKCILLATIFYINSTSIFIEVFIYLLSIYVFIYSLYFFVCVGFIQIGVKHMFIVHVYTFFNSISI